jgi:hypothetical protein
MELQILSRSFPSIAARGKSKKQQLAMGHVVKCYSQKTPMGNDPPKREKVIMSRRQVDQFLHQFLKTLEGLNITRDKLCEEEVSLNKNSLNSGRQVKCCRQL